jgi:cyclopropane-fatty-acyl-phospholipid synthase
LSTIALAIRAVERAPLPDVLTSAGIEFLVGRTRRALATGQQEDEQAFAREMVRHPIAWHPDAANRQHYELPPAYFGLALGPRRKYSCCYYPTGGETLAEAEVCALERTVEHAGLAGGHRILELGCGWGSLSLFMAERFPDARIVAVSNSSPQRQHIEEAARTRGLRNLTVVTADMNDFQANDEFDRIVSVEMFEHMSNWRSLLERARSWLTPEGRLFLHVFSHRKHSYRFDHGDRADWIAQHFFTGGIMPSHQLVQHFPDLFEVESEWRWSGRHYQRTAEDWLANFDANSVAIDRIFAEVYGAEARIWRRRWRLFFLATAGLFGHAGGAEWGVSHYRLRPAG